MNALCRAAVIGIVIGVMEVFLHLYGPEDDFTGANVMLVVPFPVGLLLGWLMRLPRWWVVAAVAPFVNVAIIAVALRGTSVSELVDGGVLPACLIFAVIGAGGQVAAAAMVVRVGWMVRFAVIGGLVVGFTGMSFNEEAIGEAARERRLARSGLALVGLGSPEYRMTYLEEWFGAWEFGTPSIELGYVRVRDDAEIELYVMSGAVVTPKAACADRLPEMSQGRSGRGGICRQVAADVWVRTEKESARVFTRYGGALVQVAGERVSVADLLAVLPALRPSTAEELAEVGEE